MNKAMLYKILISILFSFSLSFNIWMQYDTIIYSVLTFLLLATFFYYISEKYYIYITNENKKILPKQKKHLFRFCLVFSIVLLFACSLYKIVPKSDINLKVISNGMKNPLSKNSEIKIHELRIDKQFIYLENLLEKKYNNLYVLNGTRNNPKELNIKNIRGSYIQLIFHPCNFEKESGIATIIINDKVYEVDTWTPFASHQDDTTKRIKVIYRVQPSFSYIFYLFKLIYLVGWVGLFFCTLYYIGIKTLLSGKYTNNFEIPKKRILQYAIPTLITGTFMLFVFYPGIWNYDVMPELSSVFVNTFVLEHVVLWNIFLKLLFHTFPSFSVSLIILQILALSLLCGYGLYKLEQRGISKKILWITSIVFAIWPYNIIMLVNLRRDALWSIAFAGIILLLFDILENGIEKFLKSKIKVFFLILFSLIVLAFRLNGPITLIAFAIILLLYYKKYIKQLLKIILITGIIYLLSYYILSKIFIFYETILYKNQKFQVMMHQMKTAVSQNEMLPENTLLKLKKIAPMYFWKYKAENTSPHFIYFANGKLLMEKELNIPDFLSAWWSLFLNYPITFVEDYLNVNRFLWNLSEKLELDHFEEEVNIKNEIFYLDFITPETRAKILNLYNGNQSFFPKIRSCLENNFYHSLYKNSSNINLFYIIYSITIFIYIFSFFAGIYVIKNGRKYSLIIWPSFFLLLFLSLVLAQPGYRYIYLILLETPFMILHSIIKVKRD